MSSRCSLHSSGLRWARRLRAQPVALAAHRCHPLRLGRAEGALCFDAEPSPALKAGFSNDDFHVPAQRGQQAQEAFD